jgi:DDE superfamily endonuclease
MLRFFKPISPHDALQQHKHQLQQSAAASAAAAAASVTAAALRRGPGRPKKQLDASAVLLAAAALDGEEEPSTKRGKYCNWSVHRQCAAAQRAHALTRCLMCGRLASPYIHDILATYQLNLHNAKHTVAYLQRSYPQLPTESEPRFAGLAESTVRSWHDSAGKLLPKFSAVVAQGKAAQRGSGRTRVLLGHPEIEDEVKRVLSVMRERGAVVNVCVIRLVMRLVIQDKDPPLLAQLTLSKSFVSHWAREQMQYSWRVRTTPASKLPEDWREQGVEMAKRIAFFMQTYKVHPSLVINMDQTGVHLAPVDNRTYESRGAKDVRLIGAEDKRQITVCIASSLDGDMLPPQLIFQGTTVQCHPPLTAAAEDAFVHLTHSENHWSNQETMQQYIREVIVPYAERMQLKHTLQNKSHIVLVLDVWAVHKSEEFRRFLRTSFPHIHLVYVPANCTSQLQVADVMLQRPFKHGIRQHFNIWAASVLKQQIDSDAIIGLSPFLKMSFIKPLILEWVLASWSKLQQGRAFIKVGWHTCCVALYNVHDQAKRLLVLEEVLKDELDRAFVPAESEAAEESSSSEEEDEGKDVLDVMKERQFGTRKGARKRAAPKPFGYALNSQQLALSEDSDA